MNESTTQLKDTTANPAPLGLLGFGMTTVLLNLHNAGFYELNSMILAMGMCYGGAAQIVAGIMEWRKGNTFATTAFLSYGLFWFSLVAFFSFSWRLAISLTPVLVSNSSPATKEFSVDFRRSTPVSRRCSTKSTAKSSCHSVL